MNQKSTVLFSLLLILAVGCSSVTSNPTPQASPNLSNPTSQTFATQLAPTSPPATPTVEAGPMDALFSAPADPVNVITQLEAEQSQSAIISPDGGQLTAVDAAGNNFTLDIPAGALLVKTQIIMTPISSLSNLPLTNGLVAAVQFEPDGLFLYKDAILTITPAQNVPLENQVLFGYLGNGADLHLAVPGPDDNQIQVRIPHFSGYGLGSGTVADRTALSLKNAVDMDARLQQQTANLLSRARQARLQGDLPVDLSLLSEYLQSYYNLVVKPRLQAAGSSCENGQLAIQTALGYERMLQLLNITDSSSLQDIAALIETVHTTCRAEAIKQCQASPDPQILIKFDLGYERQKQLLGGSSGDSVENIVADAIKTCGFKGYKIDLLISNNEMGNHTTAIICSLEKPFQITETTNIWTYTATFTPSSPTGGTAETSFTFGGGVFEKRSGPYAVAYYNNQPYQIKWDFHLIDEGKMIGEEDLTYYYNLQPLDTAECSQP